MEILDRRKVKNIENKTKMNPFHIEEGSVGKLMENYQIFGILTIKKYLNLIQNLHQLLFQIKYKIHCYTFSTSLCLV